MTAQQLTTTAAMATIADTDADIAVRSWHLSFMEHTMDTHSCADRTRENACLTRGRSMTPDQAIIGVMQKRRDDIEEQPLLRPLLINEPCAATQNHQESTQGQQPL